jgi:hypothetical protein
MKRSTQKICLIYLFILILFSEGFGQGDVYASAVWDEPANEVILKIVSNNQKPQPIDLKAMNTLKEPKLVASLEEKIGIPGKKFRLVSNPIH